MNTSLSDLLALQQILQLGDKASRAENEQVLRFRKSIPSAMLEHFCHQLACGRRGVAFVRNGVCGECHIRLPSATLDDLRRSDDMQLCESCGCYVALPAEEAPAVIEPRLVPTPARPRRRRRKVAMARA
jgi:predicted  nucleic acid-binding Zn-ribbon protein